MLHNRVGHIVILQTQGAAHRGVHRVRGRDVGELENFLLAQQGLERIEEGFGNASVLQHEAVGVSQKCPFRGGPAVGDRPVRNGGYLLIAEARIAHGLAMLTEHELAPDGVPGPGSAPAHEDGH